MIRDRSSGVKRGLTDGSHSLNKRRNIGLSAVVGSRTQKKIRKIKSPPADIYYFLEFLRERLNNIIDDLNEADINITADDVVSILMSRPSETSI